MCMDRNVGVLLVVAGLVVSLVGVLVWAGALSWLGRLPGDLRFESGRSRVYIPIASMIVLSVLLTVVVNLVGRWWR